MLYIIIILIWIPFIVAYFYNKEVKKQKIIGAETERAKWIAGLFNVLTDIDKANTFIDGRPLDTFIQMNYEQSPSKYIKYKKNIDEPLIPGNYAELQTALCSEFLAYYQKNKDSGNDNYIDIEISKNYKPKTLKYFIKEYLVNTKKYMF